MKTLKQIIKSKNKKYVQVGREIGLTDPRYIYLILRGDRHPSPYLAKEIFSWAGQHVLIDDYGNYSTKEILRPFLNERMDKAIP